MLRPHVLLTVLVFAVIAAFAVHLATQNGSPSRNGTIASNDTNTKSGNSDGGNGYSSGDGYRRNYGGNRQDNTPGQFDYYALVLSWSPTYCAEKGEDDNTQCNRRDGRRYSFVLHGLWPQYDYGYPSACRLPRRPFVPNDVISSMMDIMPSRGLVIHEYRTHGTCSGLDPARYFTLAHQLFDGIVIPEQFRNPFEKQFVSPSEIRDEFLRSNPKLKPDMIAVVCGGAGKGLREVRICYSKDGQPRSCGRNENQNKLCSTDRVFVPPTRSTASQDSPSRWSPPSQAPATTNRQAPLPGPRMDYDYGQRTR